MKYYAQVKASIDVDDEWFVVRALNINGGLVGLGIGSSYRSCIADLMSSFYEDLEQGNISLDDMFTNQNDMEERNNDFGDQFLLVFEDNKTSSIHTVPDLISAMMPDE